MFDETNIEGLTFDSDAHEYAFNGVSVVSVTQVLQALHQTQYFGNTAARDNGSIVHGAVHLLIKGKLNRDTVPDAHKGRLDAFDAFMVDREREEWDSEFQVFHKVLQFAGTVDLLNCRGELFDIKCGAPCWWHRYQTAAYEAAIGQKLNRYCLYLRADGTYSVVRHPDRLDFTHFAAALDGVKLRKLNGVKERESNE